MRQFNSPADYAIHDSSSNSQASTTKKVVRFAIVGGGISGLALAKALSNLSKSILEIEVVIFERDASFSDRHQGYGLTLQQGSRAIVSLGLSTQIAQQSVSSSGHLIFDNAGHLCLFWKPVERSGNERDQEWKQGRNCHIPRQTLRRVLLDSLDHASESNISLSIVWNSKLNNVEFGNTNDENCVTLCFSDGVRIQADFVAGCDGIFSTVRSSLATQLFPESQNLRYLGVFIMLGIVRNMSEEEQPFQLQRGRVLQMSDGNARIFTMPYDKHNTMWQLSFPFSLDQSQYLYSMKSGAKLKEEALRQCCRFAEPFLSMIRDTDDILISGYPVFDREPLREPLKQESFPITLLGDAAHPMSPFKGQGANQALLDALSLSYEIQKCLGNVRATQSVKQCMTTAFRMYEREMIRRSTSKVLGSRKCVEELHCYEFIDTDYQLRRRGFLKPDMHLSVLQQFRNDGVRSDKITDQDLERLYDHAV